MPEHVGMEAFGVQRRASLRRAGDVDRDRVAPSSAFAAAAIGADPILLAKLLCQRHQTSAGGRLRVDGVLTNRCAVCGAKMTRKGCRAWIDTPSADVAAQRISGRLGFGAPKITTRTTWHPTRRRLGEAGTRSRRRDEGRLMTTSFYAGVILRLAPRPRRGAPRGLDAPRALHARRPRSRPLHS